MADASRRVMLDAGLSFDDLDFFIPHQANSRIISAIAQQLNIPNNKVICNVAEFGNTSSASIPIALDEIWAQGKITDGVKVLFTALGGGVTVGSVLVYF